METAGRLGGALFCFLRAVLRGAHDARFGFCDADADQADRSELGRVHAAHEADAR